MDKEFYPISTLLEHSYHAIFYYHRERCIYNIQICRDDCENKMLQLQEFRGLFIGVN